MSDLIPVTITTTETRYLTPEEHEKEIERFFSAEGFGLLTPEIEVPPADPPPSAA